MSSLRGHEPMALSTLPYDTAQTALTAAIVFANDAGSPAGISGSVLNATTNPAVIPALQERYRYLQQRLISDGVDTFTKDGVVFGLSPSASSNPRIPSLLKYSGYFNGQVWVGPNVTAPVWDPTVTYTQQMTVTYLTTYYVAQPNSGTNLNQNPSTSPTFWAPFTNLGPCLPADLIKPLEIWECQTGGNQWYPMTQNPDSLNVSNIGPRHRAWIFENDTLVLPPSSQTEDLKIKYIAMAPDIGELGTIIYPRGCATALALLLLDQFSGGRGGPMAETFKARAEEAIGQLTNQTIRKMSYVTIVRRPFRGRGRSAWRNDF